MPPSTSKVSVCDGCRWTRPCRPRGGSSFSMTSGSSCRNVIRSPVLRWVIESSATRYGGQDLHLVAVGHGRVQSGAEADVLAADVDVHEPAQAAAAVGESVAQLAVLGVQRLEHLADGGTAGLDRAAAARRVAQLRGELDGRHYAVTPTADSNAS